MSDTHAAAASSIPAPKPPRKVHRLTRADQFKLDTWVVANRNKIEAGEWTLKQMADLLTDGEFRVNDMHVRQACRTFKIKTKVGGRRGSRKTTGKADNRRREYRKAVKILAQQLVVFRDKLLEVGVVVELSERVAQMAIRTSNV